MELWTGAQRAFAVKAFYKNGDSFMIAQREFRREFGIHRNRAVPSAHAIKTNMAARAWSAIPNLGSTHIAR
jgi:hypothetical protein